jgi:hypothetical protein
MPRRQFLLSGAGQQAVGEASGDEAMSRRLDTLRREIDELIGHFLSQKKEGATIRVNATPANMFAALGLRIPEKLEKSECAEALYRGFRIVAVKKTKVAP